MTNDQLDAACRAFCRRRPFRPFVVEFVSGQQLVIKHPEAIRREAHFFLTRSAGTGYVFFTGDGVSRLLDVPTA